MSTIFVTVGSTGFDSLVSKVLDINFLMSIKELGFEKMIIQAGNSRYTQVDSKWPILVELYDYKSNILDDAQKADLVIGHAGAGTCLEMLRLRKSFIIVVNESLMDNHQLDLAVQLAENNYARVSNVGNLLESIHLVKSYGFCFDILPVQSNAFEKIFDTELARAIR